MSGTDVLASRGQYRSDIQRLLYGTLGAASAIRKVDVSTVDATALVAQIDNQTARAEAKRRAGQV
jgi:hypothetical protein